MSIKIYHICNGVNEGMKEEYHRVYKKIKYTRYSSRLRFLKF